MFPVHKIGHRIEGLYGIVNYAYCWIKIHANSCNSLCKEVLHVSKSYKNIQ